MSNKLIVILSCVFFITGCSDLPQSPQLDNPALETVTITIDKDTVINENITGLGWNLGPLWIPTPTYDDQNELEQFFDLLKEAKPSWIRLMFNYYEWECKITNAEAPIYENDDDDPWTKPQEFLSEDFVDFVWNHKSGLDWRMK